MSDRLAELEKLASDVDAQEPGLLLWEIQEIKSLRAEVEKLKAGRCMDESITTQYKIDRAEDEAGRLETERDILAIEKEDNRQMALDWEEQFVTMRAEVKRLKAMPVGCGPDGEPDSISLGEIAELCAEVERRKAELAERTTEADELGKALELQYRELPAAGMEQAAKIAEDWPIRCCGDHIAAVIRAEIKEVQGE